MVTARRIVQVVIFLFFLTLFLLTTYPYAAQIKVPLDLFLHLTPLVVLADILVVKNVTVVVIAGVIVLLLAIFFGRIFCGWICPLGTMIDASDRLFFPTSKRKEPKSDYSHLKYYLLLIIVIFALFGVQIAYLFDPIVIIERTFTLSFFPLILGIKTFLGYISPFFNSLIFAPVLNVYFKAGLSALLIFVLILGLGAVSQRFWCRNLCPLGALLGIFSSFNILKRRVSEKCNRCMLCYRDCKMGAIDKNPENYDPKSCIQCVNCEKVCPQQAITFDVSAKKQGELRGFSLTRRYLLHSLALSFVGISVFKSNFGSKIPSNRLIRPPASLPEKEFVKKCIRCQECVKICMTNGLQPTFLEGGVDGFWTPSLVPKLGHCEENCNLCGTVCPTDAIKPFKIEDKKNIFIGRAYINAAHCIAFNSTKRCLICAEHCSYNAIDKRTLGKREVPVIDAEKCVGCGICENKCPVEPESAIIVYANPPKRN